jgi:hypothetical protein
MQTNVRPGEMLLIILRLIDANRRPLWEANGFAAEMREDRLSVVERNKFLSKKLDDSQSFGWEKCPEKNIVRINRIAMIKKTR